MARKCSKLCVAMMALVALLFTVGGRASASPSYQYLYVNAQVATSVPTYVWANCYQYQGQLGGQFYLGDTSGINFLQGIPTVMTFPTPGNAHVEGIGIWNGQLATFIVDFQGDTTISYQVTANGQSVWSSGFFPSGSDQGLGYFWAGIYMSP